MDASRKMMQLIQGAFLVSIVLYAVITKMLPASVAPNVLIFRILILLSVGTVAMIFVLRRKLVKPAEQPCLPSPKTLALSRAGAADTLLRTRSVKLSHSTAWYCISWALRSRRSCRSSSPAR